VKQNVVSSARIVLTFGRNKSPHFLRVQMPLCRTELARWRRGEARQNRARKMEARRDKTELARWRLGETGQSSQDGGETRRD
jgi:hypothetical protein